MQNAARSAIALTLLVCIPSACTREEPTQTASHQPTQDPSSLVAPTPATTTTTLTMGEGASKPANEPVHLTGEFAAETDAEPLNESGMSALDQRRYDRMGVALLNALNAGDADAYRGMFTPEAWAALGTTPKGMFRAAIDGHGRIERGYAPRAIADSPGDAVMPVTFEDGATGTITFALADDDRIARLLADLESASAQAPADRAVFDRNPTK